MKTTIHDPAAAPAETAASAELTPEHIAARRRYCAWLQYWRDCANSSCRRARSCAGDPTDCFLFQWLGRSETGRVWVAAGIRAVERGLTARNAAAEADLALLHHVKSVDRLPQYLRRGKRWRWIEHERDAGVTRGSARSDRRSERG